MSNSEIFTLSRVLNVFLQFKEIETMSIEKCHPFVQDFDEEEETLEPYFADPTNDDGARITQFQVWSLLVHKDIFVFLYP